jgi:peptide/nickel transport system substrate-binding protein
MKMMHALLAATAFTLVAATATVEAKSPPNVLVVAKNIDDIVSLDPGQAYEFTSGEVVSNIYDRLVEYNPADIEKVVPGLAESWTISDDGKTITFKLRSGAKFASGNPVRPEDVVFSFKRVVVLKKPPAFMLAQFGWTPENVEQMVKKVSDSEVSITITENFASSFVLNALAARTGSIVDEQTVMKNVKDNDLGNAWLSRNSAGSGPFTLRTWRPNEVVVIQANPTHYRGVPKINQVVFNHVVEASTQRLLVEQGDADIARNLGPDQIAALRDRPGVKIETYPQATVHFMSFNVKHEKLKNPAIWEAARYLVDYEGIANQLLRGQMKVHQTFWPAGFPGSVPDTPYKLDVAKAKDILAKAGVSNLTIDMDIIASAPFTDIAQSIQSTMAQGGIKLNLLPGTTTQVITKYRARQQEAALLYWGPDFMDPHSNAKAFAYNVDNSDGNYQSTTTWRNSWLPPAELSAMTRAALVERDPAKRLEMYRELQRRVLVEAPWVMTFQAQAQVAQRAEVQGFVHGPSSDLVLYRGVTKN